MTIVRDGFFVYFISSRIDVPISQQVIVTWGIGAESHVYRSSRKSRLSPDCVRKIGNTTRNSRNSRKTRIGSMWPMIHHVSDRRWTDAGAAEPLMTTIETMAFRATSSKTSYDCNAFNMLSYLFKWWSCWECKQWPRWKYFKNRWECDKVWERCEKAW